MVAWPDVARAGGGGVNLDCGGEGLGERSGWTKGWKGMGSLGDVT